METEVFDSALISYLAGPLIAWFEVNARVLPWRSTSEKKVSPYGIWVSEKEAAWRGSLPPTDELCEAEYEKEKRVMGNA